MVLFISTGKKMRMTCVLTGRLNLNLRSKDPGNLCLKVQMGDLQMPACRMFSIFLNQKTSSHCPEIQIFTIINYDQQNEII